MDRARYVGRNPTAPTVADTTVSTPPKQATATSPYSECDFRNRSTPLSASLGADFCLVGNRNKPRLEGGYLSRESIEIAARGKTGYDELIWGESITESVLSPIEPVDPGMLTLFICPGSSTDFSLWLLDLPRTYGHRLKSMLLPPHSSTLVIR
jgi:hypothetical protein